MSIGVLSHRGYAATLSSWSPTADYLTRHVKDHAFEIVPLDFDEVEDAVGKGKVDFLLVNPGIYVNMEVKYRISRIATLRNRLGGVAYNNFGGVIFTRNANTQLNILEELKGVSFMAVDRTSLGGFQMTWRELKAAGMDPYRNFSRLAFGGTHDQVVLTVLQGKVEAGTVRTDILERMAAAGTIDMQQVRIIGRQKTPDFPFAHSTRLYPEWPFSKVAHTSNALAQRVAVALLNMPTNDAAALAGNYAGWTIPLDYQQVHELFKELHLPPYEDLGKFTLVDAVRQYWHWLLLGLVTLLFMIFMTLWVMRLNTELKKANIRLERQYELILNSVADGIYGVDVNGNSTFVNRAMQRITGWTENDLIGKNQHLILHHTKADGTRHSAKECPVYQTFRDNIPRFVADDVFWCKDGSYIPVEYT
ncbi:MAG TPA: PAS domain S-box protein, partial [Chromatiales bacterium]|nr:PAS domain S-box protein [Chromatiales bacterium]